MKNEVGRPLKWAWRSLGEDPKKLIHKKHGHGHLQSACHWHDGYFQFDSKINYSANNGFSLYAGMLGSLEVETSQKHTGFLRKFVLW